MSKHALLLATLLAGVTSVASAMPVTNATDLDAVRAIAHARIQTSGVCRLPDSSFATIDVDGYQLKVTPSFSRPAASSALAYGESSMDQDWLQAHASYTPVQSGSFAAIGGNGTAATC